MRGGHHIHHRNHFIAANLRKTELKAKQYLYFLAKVEAF
jgi:hypothetical protein